MIDALEMFFEVWRQHNVFVALAVLAVVAVVLMLLSLAFKALRKRKDRLVKLAKNGWLRERIVIDHQINHALQNLIRSLDCDRTYITQFHNGGANVCGVPFAKCSRTHERVRPGATSQITALQNLPVSMSAGVNLAIMRDREIACPDIETLAAGNDPMGAYHSLREQDVRSFYQIGMFSFDGVPVGVLGIDYCREKRKLNRRELSSLRAYALKLCGMIISEKSNDKGENVHECLPGRA